MNRLNTTTTLFPLAIVSSTMRNQGSVRPRNPNPNLLWLPSMALASLMEEAHFLLVLRCRCLRMPLGLLP